MKGNADIYESMAEAVEAGNLGEQYSAEDATTFRQIAADIRSVSIGGSSKKADLN